MINYNYTTKRLKSKVIDDKKISAKEKLNKKKERNIKTYAHIKKHLSDKPKSVKRFRECSFWLRGEGDKELNKIKVTESNACKNRFCPQCAWQKAKKDAMIINAMMKYVELDLKKSLIMLTLTAPNVKGEVLKDEIYRYNRAYNNMIDRTEARRIIKGFIRKLEVTYNKEPIITNLMWFGNKNKGGKRKPMADYFTAKGLKVGDPNPNYNTYHCHFHCIIAVNKSYFTDKTYIKHERWLQLWQEAMQDPSITQVHVTKLASRGKDSGLSGRASEIAKYTAKDSDYNYSQEVFDIFYKALKGRQLLTYAGVFKEAMAKYKAKELDNYIPEDMTEYVWELLLLWGYDEKSQKWDKEKHEYGIKGKNSIKKITKAGDDE